MIQIFIPILCFLVGIVVTVLWYKRSASSAQSQPTKDDSFQVPVSAHDFIDSMDMFIFLTNDRDEVLYMNQTTRFWASENKVTRSQSAVPFLEQFFDQFENSKELMSTYEQLKSVPDFNYREEMKGKDGQLFIRSTRGLLCDDGSVNRFWVIRPLNEVIGDQADAKFATEQMAKQAEQNAYLAEELFAAREEMKRLAHTDPLTGLMNRRSYMLETSNLISSLYDNETIQVLMLDIDYFKNINDTNGHTIGDECIKAVSALARKHSPESALIGRMGGEEFSVAIKMSVDDVTLDIAEDIRGAIENHVIDGYENPIKMTISIGMATHHPKEDVLDNALDRADQALYKAKTSGRNKVIQYTG